MASIRIETPPEVMRVISPPIVPGVAGPGATQPFVDTPRVIVESSVAGRLLVAATLPDAACPPAPRQGDAVDPARPETAFEGALALESPPVGGFSIAPGVGDRLLRRLVFPLSAGSPAAICAWLQNPADATRSLASASAPVTVLRVPLTARVRVDRPARARVGRPLRIVTDLAIPRYAGARFASCRVGQRAGRRWVEGKVLTFRSGRGCRAVITPTMAGVQRFRVRILPPVPKDGTRPVALTHWDEQTFLSPPVRVGAAG